SCKVIKESSPTSALNIKHLVNAISFGDFTLKCNACDVASGSKSNVYQHLNGTNHRSALLKESTKMLIQDHSLFAKICIICNREDQQLDGACLACNEIRSQILNTSFEKYTLTCNACNVTSTN